VTVALPDDGNVSLVLSDEDFNQGIPESREDNSDPG
jgi:hypothetical protein